MSLFDDHTECKCFVCTAMRNVIYVMIYCYLIMSILHDLGVIE